MAIIVDKEQKKKDIAVACTDLLLDKGLKNLRISDIATTAGIGKGTVYDYFANKEEVVFEIIRNLIIEHQNDLSERSDKDTSCRQKVFYLFDFYLCEYKDYSKHLEVYKEYLDATIASKNPAMYAFNNECIGFIQQILSTIIEDGINNKALMPAANECIEGMIATERGFMMLGWTENKCYKQNFKNYINTLFDLLETKL
jgi:AcrR family transcriptional regulator